MSTATATTIDRDALLKQRIAEDSAELRRIQEAAAIQTRDKLRQQTLVQAEQGVKDTEERVASFDKLIADAYEKLKAAVATRHREYRGRMHMPEANVHVNGATTQLVLQLNGKLEWELTLQQVRKQYEEALRMEQKFTPVERA